MTDNTGLLFKALTANAVFSALSALALLVAPDWIAVQLGLTEPAYVTATAVLLGVFALQLAQIVRTRRIRTWEIATIIGGDLAWVLASLVLGVLYFEQFTSVGAVLVFGIALVVLAFAELQGFGLMRLRRS